MAESVLSPDVERSHAGGGEDFDGGSSWCGASGGHNAESSGKRRDDVTTDEYPDVLWHYTNLEGLLGIAKYKCLWATDARYLNDSTELTHGRDCLQAAWDIEVAIARKIEAGEPFTGEEPAFGPERLTRILKVTSKGIHKVTVVAGDPAPFVTCFSADGDRLSQWRGYAAGKGYALGFKRKTLDELAASNARTARLLKVEYIHDRVPAVGSKVDDNGRVVLTSIEQAWFKHPGFDEEQEWRIAVAAPTSADPEWQFRSGAQGLTPYIDLDISRYAPTEVKIGPGGNRPLRAAALRSLLDAKGWPDTGIGESKTPYRG